MGATEKLACGAPLPDLAVRVLSEGLLELSWELYTKPCFRPRLCDSHVLADL